MTVALAKPDRLPGSGAGDGPRRFEPGPASRCEDERDRILALVGQGREVLEIGDAAGPLAPALRARSCRVTTIEGHAGPHDAGAEPGDGRFDVLLAADLLPRVEDPATIFGLAKATLRPGGSLIATAPNVAHGSVRLALMRGHFPYAQGVLEHSHRRFFTRSSLVALIEDAGFVIAHIEPVELPTHDPDAAAEGEDSTIPATSLEGLAGDPEARAARYIVVAHPLPHPGLDWIQDRFRDLAEREEAATREAAELRRVVAAMTAQVESLSRLGDRERETHARLMEAHARLAHCDLEFREQMARRVEETRDALARHDRDANASIAVALAERDKFVARCNELEARLERIRGSLPGRLYRKAAALLRAFAR